MWLLLVHTLPAASQPLRGLLPLLVVVTCGDVPARGAGERNSAYNDAQSDDDDDEPADVLEAILGQVGQREDTGYDDDGVDVSVGVDDSAVVGVSMHGQVVNLSFGQGVDLVVGSLPLTSLDS